MVEVWEIPGTEDKRSGKVILLLAVLAGLFAGLVRSHLAGQHYRPTNLGHVWLVIVSILPQIFAFYLPITRESIPQWLAKVCLLSSMLGLLVFVWINKAYWELWVIGVGLILNLLVIAVNGGFMPISPHTVAALYPEAGLDGWGLGSRLEWSKNIVLQVEGIHLAFLRDFLVFPEWVPWRYAFSAGDVLIAAGVFLLLWDGGKCRSIG